MLYAFCGKTGTISTRALSCNQGWQGVVRVSARTCALAFPLFRLGMKPTAGVWKPGGTVFFVHHFTREGVIMAKRSVIKAGHIIHPHAGLVEDGQYILIEDGIIRDITADAGVKNNADEFFDLSDNWVFPGLFDCHTHFCNPGLRPRGTGVQSMVENYYLGLICARDGYSALRGAWHAADYLRCGFTSVRDVGNAPRFVEVDLKRALMEGKIPGPHMQIMGQKIVVTGGQVVSYGTTQLHQPPDPNLLINDAIKYETASCDKF